MASKSKAKPQEQTQHQVLAEFCTTLLGNIASSAWNKDAHLNESERENVEKPLAAILERLDVENIEKANAIVQPVMLAVGLVGWYLRVRPQGEDKGSGNPPKPPDQPIPQPPMNGVKPLDVEGLAQPLPEWVHQMQWGQS